MISYFCPSGSLLFHSQWTRFKIYQDLEFILLTIWDHTFFIPKPTVGHVSSFLILNFTCFPSSFSNTIPENLILGTMRVSGENISLGNNSHNRCGESNELSMPFKNFTHSQNYHLTFEFYLFSSQLPIANICHRLCQNLWTFFSCDLPMVSRELLMQRLPFGFTVILT